MKYSEFFWKHIDTLSSDTSLAHSFGEKVWDHQQQEIDELQNKYDTLHEEFITTDEACKEWSRCYLGVRVNEDLLQERIIKALDTLEGRKDKVSFDYIIDILKGTQG